MTRVQMQSSLLSRTSPAGKGTVENGGSAPDSVKPLLHLPNLSCAFSCPLGRWERRCRVEEMFKEEVEVKVEVVEVVEVEKLIDTKKQL